MKKRLLNNAALALVAWFCSFGCQTEPKVATYSALLKTWQPIRTYEVMGSTFVVQHDGAGVESGKIVVPMVSSTMPEGADYLKLEPLVFNGEQFIRMGGDLAMVYNYQKRK
jgi:hypothetical protein